MTRGSGTPSSYDCTAVERALLEVAVELHPRHLTADGLRAKIVRDPDDARAVETAEEAIRRLREFGVLSDTDDGLLGATPAACRTAALLMG
jgi:hypothetical protein